MRYLGRLIVLLCLVTPAEHVVGQESDLAAMQALSVANGFLKRGHFDRAIESYQSFLAEYPEHERASECQYGLAVCLVRTAQHDKAIALLSKLNGQESFEYKVDSGILLAESYTQVGDFLRAATTAQAISERHSDHPLAADAAIIAVEAYYKLANHTQVCELSERFAKQWPKDDSLNRVRYTWAASLFRTERYERAARELKRLLASSENGELRAHAQLLLAQCVYNSGEAREAESLYTQIINDKKHKHRDVAIVGMVQSLMRSGEYREALGMLNEHIQAYPDSLNKSWTVLHRGRCLFEIGEYQQAIAVLAQVREASLADRAQYWHAKCAMRLGQFDVAIKVLNMLESKFPDSQLRVEADYDRAVCFIRMGQFDVASEALERFLNDHDGHELCMQAWRALASAHLEARQYDRCKDVCLRFLAKHTAAAQAEDITFILAEAQYAQSDYAASADSYSAYIKSYSQGAHIEHARFQYAACAYQMKSYDRALTLLKPIAESSDTQFKTRAIRLLGETHFQLGQWQEAAAALSLSLDDDTTHADDARLKQAISMGRVGKADQALELLESLLRHGVDVQVKGQAMFELGQLLLATDRESEAREQFESFRESYPDSDLLEHALANLSVIALRQQDYGEALDCCNALIASAQDEAVVASAMLNKAHALSQLKRHRDAYEAHRQFLSKFPSHPQATESRVAMVNSLSREGDLDEALNEVKKQQRAADLKGDQRERLLYEQAWLLSSKGDVDRARAIYHKIAESASERDIVCQSFAELAHLEFSVNNWQQAREAYAKLFEALPKTSKALSDTLRSQARYQDGVCAFKLNQYDDAAKSFALSLEGSQSADRSASALFYCGEAHLKTGRYTSAVEYFVKLTTDHGQNENAISGLLRLGECYAQLQRWAESEEVLSRFLTRYANHDMWFQAAFGQAWAQQNRGRYGDAISRYRHVVARHQGPTAARAQFQIGECLFAQNQYEAAITEYLKVEILFEYPQWRAAALYEAGRCFEQLNRVADAQQQFKRVLEIDGQTDWAKLATKRLSALPLGESSSGS